MNVVDIVSFVPTYMCRIVMHCLILGKVIVNYKKDGGLFGCCLMMVWGFF